MKRVIALGMLLLGGALLVAPGSGAATSECPPGQTGTPPYCQNAPPPPPVLKTHLTRATPGGLVEVTVSCPAGGPTCKGTLCIVVGGNTVGCSTFTIKPGESAKVKVKLSPSERKKLACTGKIRVAVVTVVNGKKTIIGHVIIKGKKTACKKHVTHAHGHPGFTG